MKTNKLKITVCALTISLLGFFTACEKEDVLVEENISVDTSDSTEAQSKMNGPYLSKVYRFYKGGGQSLHTYRVNRVGVGIGTSEGAPFKLGIYSKIFTPNPPAGTSKVYFLLSRGHRDFLMTINAAERRYLLASGWIDFSEWNRYGRNQSAYIHNSGGSGRVKLYRFYGSSNTDHLFTTNYNEGIIAGYTYEGVVGWVHR